MCEKGREAEGRGRSSPIIINEMHTYWVMGRRHHSHAASLERPLPSRPAGVEGCWTCCCWETLPPSCSQMLFRSCLAVRPRTVLGGSWVQPCEG
jgi:hypothetical protein